MENQTLLTLIGIVAAAVTVGATIDPGIYLKAEQESQQIIDIYNARKTSEYDQICRVLRGCTKRGGDYVL